MTKGPHTHRSSRSREGRAATCAAHALLTMRAAAGEVNSKTSMEGAASGEPSIAGERLLQLQSRPSGSVDASLGQKPLRPHGLCAVFLLAHDVRSADTAICKSASDRRQATPGLTAPRGRMPRSGEAGGTPAVATGVNLRHRQVVI